MNKKIIISLVCGIGLAFFWVQNQMEENETDLLPQSVDEEIIPAPEPAVVIAEDHTGKKQLSSDDFDHDIKRKEVIDLVTRGIDFFEKNSLSVACETFSHAKDFVYGELYLFVFDMDGIVYAYGEEESLLWHNLYNFKDDLGVLVVQNIIKKAKEGGGWITYQWRNATKISYVKMVTKNEKAYIIGSGYYSHSKADQVVNLVKGAVALFNRVKKEGLSKSEVFGDLNYPLGRFVNGDLYLYALDFKGIIVAQGDRPGLVGSNAWESRDDKGVFINQEIIKKLQNTAEETGIWLEYTSKNALKRTYAEKVQDTEGNWYFIACGYYPSADREALLDLVRRGYQFVKAQGKSAAVQEFSDKRINTFRYGDLSLFMFDMKGVCIAHGTNDEWVGKNLWNVTDEDGFHFIQAFIKKAQEGGGWINAKLKNTFSSIYVEKLDLGIEEFVIGSGMYASSKKDVMELLVKTGVGFIKTQGLAPALGEFVKPDSKFIRGDLGLFVFDDAGICYVYSDEVELIWRNLLDLKDDNGKQFIKVFINTAKRGPGTVHFTLNKAPAIAYVEPAEKDGINYVVGSYFYQSS